ncbi:MAG: ABC transporter substrate-binding protein [Pararhodobacter sp.]|nr:ABC transporter substrate-binding protein [Pararhodobacter sp.]
MPTNFSRRWLTGASAIAMGVSVALAGLMPASAQADTTTLTAVMNGNLRSLDPTVSTAQIVRTHGFMVYDTLLGMDEHYQPQPQMAEYDVSEDGLVYTFTLRDGLLWHDGTPVTADDCVASLERWGRYDSTGGMMMGVVDSIEAISDTQFVLTLSEPFGHVLQLIAKPSPIPPFMMPRHLAETPDGEQIPEQIGSGPFRFVAEEFRPGDRVVYVRNDDYLPRDEPSSWTAGGKVVHVDRVVWQSMPDLQTAINALGSGDIDFIEQLPHDLAQVTAALPNVEVGIVRPVGMQITGRMNHTLAPFDDVEVRQAALLALDPEEMIQASIGNPDYYSVCASIYGCGTPLASDAGSEWLFGDGRRDRARELLAASSYDGTPLILLQQTELPAFSPQPLLAAQRLREVGFNVEVQSVDWQTQLNRQNSRVPVSEGGWNMIFSAWGITGIWDPLISTVINASGTGRAWAGWPVDEELEALRREFASTTDPDAQQSIARAVQERVLEQVIYLPMGEYDIVSAWRDSVQNMPAGPLTLFWSVSMSD